MAIEQQATVSPGVEFYGGHQVCSDTGVDLTLLRENLKRTIEERFVRNSYALELVEALRGRVTRMSEGAKSKGPWRLIHQLVEQKVRFVVVGSFAMMAHGLE